MTKKELIRELEEKKWELQECQIIAQKQSKKITQLENQKAECYFSTQKAILKKTYKEMFDNIAMKYVKAVAKYKPGDIVLTKSGRKKKIKSYSMFFDIGAKYPNVAYNRGVVWEEHIAKKVNKKPKTF